MKHLPSTLTLICVALTVIAFPATVPAAETSILDSSKKIELPGGVSLEMVKVESGTFEMSAKDGENLKYEVPHQVTLTRDFYIGRTEVTQAQWKAVMGTNPSYFKGDNLPVESVSWNDVMSFCEKLNSKGNAPSGWMFTLPTETQWEYAARGGKESKGYKYSGSDIIDAVAWYWENSGDRRLDDDSSWDFLLRESNHCKTHPVGQKKANELGLYDMSGNVYEWCLDDWNDDSSKLTAEFTRGNDQSGTDRALRSGSWDEISRKGRSMYRYRFPPNSRLINFGFRLALVQISNNKSGESQITARDSGSGSTTENVSADAQFKQGLEYYEKNDYSEAIKLFKNAAEQGNVSAQYKLGICYKNGFGDYAEAMKWFRKAADQGNAEAQYELGYCYENRLGNQNEAVVWYQKASDNGNEDAKKKIEQLAEENVERNISLENRKKIELSGGVSLEMVKVEAGTFEMSVMNGIKSGFGEVAHPATLTQDFFIGKTEVTQAQWKEVMGENPVAYLSLSYSVIGDNLPVVEVSWSKAMEFCEKLNATGKAPNGWKFTLPTETQWEYAARGGNKSKGYKYSGSNNIDEVAWYYGNSGDRKLDDSSFSLTLMESNNCRPHPVGQKKANELGLYDMSGNVYEWCLDDWQDKSDTLKAEFSRENDRGKSSRTIRGGAFLYLSELSHPARRNIGHNGDRSNFTGFRLALVQANNSGSQQNNSLKTNANTEQDMITLADSIVAHFTGLEHYRNRNYSEAVKYFRKAAEQGYAESQTLLGLCYSDGTGVKQDFSEAVKWFRRAAEQGNPEAQFALGAHYLEGKGVREDINEGLKWIRKAAEQDEHYRDVLRAFEY